MELVIEKLGLNAAWSNSEFNENTNCIAIGAGGRGFVGTETYGKWVDALKERTPSGFNTELVTKIVIVGGYNDQYYTYDEIEAAMDSFNAYVASTFKNATIDLMCVGAHTSDLTRMPKMGTVFNAYSNCGRLKNWKYHYGGESLVMNQAYMTADDHHPNNAGGAVLAKAVLQAIANVPITPNCVRSVINLDNDITSNFESSIISWTDGHYTHMTFTSPFTLEFSTAQNGRISRTLGTIDSTYFIGKDNLLDSACATCTIEDDTGKQMCGQVWFYVYKNTVKIAPRLKGINYKKIIVPVGVNYTKDIYD